jgi:glycosyltransferase involved in cell wall biosynthesis
MKISIITVTYNSERFINDCLNSVSFQTYKNYEHIIIDGASNDNTLSILNNYNSKKKIIISKSDKGMYYAMNFGINKSKGDIVAILNSDDFYSHKNVLSNVIKCFKKYKFIDGCYSDLIYVDRKNKKKIVRKWKSSKFIKGSHAKGWSIPHTTLFLRKDVYNKFGFFDTNFKFASDIDLMVRFFEIYNIKTKYLSDTFITMRYGGASTSSLRRIILQNIEILKSFKKNKINYKITNYILCKFLSRIKQFFF